MASARRKSAAIALAVIGIAGLSLAAAATLSVTATNIGAGVSLVATCDSAVSVSFTNTYAAGGYAVDTVVVSGIDAAACDGQTIGITVAGVTPAEQLISAATATFTVAGVLAEDVVDVAVIIYE